MRSIWLRVWAEKKWARLNVVSSVAEIVLLLLLLLCLWFMLIGQRAGSYVDGQAGRQAGRLSVLYSNVFNSVFVLINECLSIHNLSINLMHNEIIIL